MRIKRNTKLKGMTLVEVIVALAVFTIMASLLVTACMSVSKSIVRTNRLVREINIQAPLAENRITNDKDKVEDVSDSQNTIVIKSKSGVTLVDSIIIDNYHVKNSNQHGSETVSGRFKFFEYRYNT